MQAAKGQDRALQHSEDLRLALAAAAREVADLQSQAAVAAAGLEGPAVAALQAVSREAQHWRDAAEGRVAAAQQAEAELRREAAQLQQRALANRSGTAQGLQQLLAAYVQRRRQTTEEEQGGGSTAEQVPAAVPVSEQPAVPATGPVTWQAAVAVQPSLPAAVPAPVPPSLPAVQYSAASSAQQHAHALQPAVPAVERIFGLPAASPRTGAELQAPPQPQPATAGAAAGMPPSRTASDILAAYRARQQQRSSAGGSAVAAASRSRSSSLSHEVSGAAASEDSEGAGPVMAGAAAQLPAEGNEPSTYSIDGFVTDESSKF